jgi:hypothetical protein
MNAELESLQGQGVVHIGLDLEQKYRSGDINAVRDGKDAGAIAKRATEEVEYDDGRSSRVDALEEITCVWSSEAGAVR